MSGATKNMAEVLRQTRETGDFSPLLESIPYAGYIGLQCERFGDDLIFRLPRKDSNLGNPLLPAIQRPGSRSPKTIASKTWPPGV